MDSRKVLSFLNFLNSKTINHKETLADLYKNALDEDDTISHLKHTLNTSAFYNEKGHRLYRDGNAMINTVYSSPVKALDVLPRLHQISDLIDSEMERSSNLLSSPFPFDESINVLNNNDITVYIQFFRRIASTCVYLIALYSGLDAIRDLTWNENDGIQEMVYLVNTKFIPALSTVYRANNYWMIRRRRFSGSSVFGGGGFSLTYESIKSVDYQCSNLRTEAIGTHIFLNIDAYERDIVDVPYCWGTGNLLSCSPNNALGFLQKDIVTKIRAPEEQELKYRMPTPLECVKYLSGGKMFCITPDDLVKAMNQWKIGQEIERRKNNGICLFCGKPTGRGRLVCSSHFTTEL